MQLRKAAATARKYLVTAAVQKLSVPEAELIVENGFVRPKSGGAGVSCGDLIGGSDFALLEVPEVTIELIDRPNEKPWGGGEPSAAVIPSAI